VSQATVDHLVSLYGSRASDVIRLAASSQALAEALAPGTPDIAAQVIFSVRTEQCLKVSDFLLRRTRLGFGPDQGRLALPRVATLMAAELGWSGDERDAECAAYVARIEDTQAFRRNGQQIPATKTDFSLAFAR